ncbi:lipopolysaccharide biosynthesis protein [Parabacteroides goldsteinii]
MIYIRFITKTLGIDKSILYTFLGRIVQGIGGIISILFVAKYLTSTEQGFYYTFGSIVAIQVFFELGLNGIITQYVAHEASHLQWKDSMSLTGDQKYLSRLSSLLHFSVKWYSCFALLLLVTLIIVGFVFFTKFQTSTDNVVWKLPWILLTITTSTNLLIAPILAFFEGLSKVKEVAQIRLVQQGIGLIVLCGGLFMGAKLFVSGINWLVGIIIVLTLIWNSNFKPIFINIWKTEITERVNYKKEIFPYQWKIAISWISGYFIFQLFNPVLFATEGAIVAGQMGMTLTILNGIQSFSLSWMTTKIPLFSGLIAQKQYRQLDLIFNKTLKQSIFINGVALILMFVCVFIIRYYHIIIGSVNLGKRFLDYYPMIFMMIPLFINQWVNSWAMYLRCHKEEPFLVNSLTSGILCCLSTILLGKFYGIYGITSGYCIISILFIPWGYWIFKTKKYNWHEH